VYRTTEKGLAFIDRYEELTKFGLGPYECVTEPF
jgi:hypothetical protein